jgi:hypothetical protein
MDVPGAVGEDPSHGDPNHELSFGPVPQEESSRWSEAIPSTRIRWRDSKSRNSIPTRAVSTTLPMDRNMPLPS